MNAVDLLVHYDRIADVSDAIVQLRHFILDLAVRGKLVPQDAKEESAAALLKRVSEERVRRVERGEIRGKPILPTVAENEMPFHVPETWKWVGVTPIWFESGHFECVEGLLRLARNEMRRRQRR